MVPVVGATLIAKAVYYPISDFTGTNFCYFVTYTYHWVGIYGQALTFFMTVFRYICLYHEEKLLRWNIKPKVSLSMYFLKKCYVYSHLSNKQGVLLIVFGIFSQPSHLGNYFAILFFLHLSTLLGY